MKMEISSRHPFYFTLFAYAMALFTTLGLPAAQASVPAPEKATAKYEIRFMEDMIDHHMMAINMAELYLAKAVHPELQTLCQQIITAQQSEIDTLQGWLRDWYDVRYEPAAMSPADQNMMDRLATLSGAEFEIAFMTQMIKHHRRAIVESSVCLQRAYHDDLVSLCEDIIAAQSAEIVQMRTWLCEWYGKCGRRRNR